MLLLGLDPGLRHTGWCVISSINDKSSWIASGNISPKISLTLSERLKDIHQGLDSIIQEYQPSVAAIEEVFVNMNGQSSLKLGMARGAAITACSINEMPVHEYSPTRVKQSVTGSGRAKKDQVAAMVKLLLPGCIINSEDESDALAVAICHTVFASSKIHQLNIRK
jgi:crossover junction endodeoxyribonuclease RuvC